jgi:hypothetical protein
MVGVYRVTPLFRLPYPGQTPRRPIAIRRSRPPAVVVDFPGEPSREQLEALTSLASAFTGLAEVDVSLSETHPIFARGTERATDEIMAFLVPWKPEADRATTQGYWLSHHGPLAKDLIARHRHPEHVKSYVQVHTDREQPSGAFSGRYQGICFEHIESIMEIALDSLEDPKTSETSAALAIDEYAFSEGPALVFFEPLLF